LRLNRVFLFGCMALSLGACSLAGTIQTHMITPAKTNQVATTTFPTPSLTPISISEQVFTPTYTTAPLQPIVTSEVINITSIMPSETLTITIVYDNYQSDQRLSTAWGFSTLIEYGDYSLLFDTGGDGQILMENMRTLGIDPTRIDSVVLSHAHDDHTGGLSLYWILVSSRWCTCCLPSRLPSNAPLKDPHKLARFFQDNPLLRDYGPLEK